MESLLVMALLILSTLADKESCQNVLQKCYNTAIDKIDKFDNKYYSTHLQEVCGIYKTGQTCIDNSACPGVKDFGNIRGGYKKNLKDYIGGRCTPAGKVSVCMKEMAHCHNLLKDVKQYFLSDDEETKLDGCYPAYLFDVCVNSARTVCPRDDMLEMEEMVVRVAVATKKEKCDPDCLNTIQACVYFIKSATKEGYCDAHKMSVNCLKEAKTQVGCSKEQSQRELDTAVKYHNQKYKDENCSNGAPWTASLAVSATVLLLSVTLFSRMFM